MHDPLLHMHAKHRSHAGTPYRSRPQLHPPNMLCVRGMCLRQWAVALDDTCKEAEIDRHVYRVTYILYLCCFHTVRSVTSAFLSTGNFTYSCTCASVSNNCAQTAQTAGTIFGYMSEMMCTGDPVMSGWGCTVDT